MTKPKTIEQAIAAAKRSLRIAGIDSVWSVTPESVSSLMPHQRGHLRRAVKLYLRLPLDRDGQMQLEATLSLLPQNAGKSAQLSIDEK